MIVVHSAYYSWPVTPVKIIFRVDASEDVYHTGAAQGSVVVFHFTVQAVGPDVAL